MKTYLWLVCVSSAVPPGNVISIIPVYIQFPEGVSEFAKLRAAQETVIPEYLKRLGYGWGLGSGKIYYTHIDYGELSGETEDRVAQEVVRFQISKRIREVN